MAKYSAAHQGTFDNYHNTFFIEMTDLHEGSNLQFLGEYFNNGKRSDNNQPGVSGKSLDKAHDGSRSIFHYFCNRAKALTGVAGGMMYRYNGVYLYIGFSNPRIGINKAFVELRQEQYTAKWAYEQLEYRDDKMSTCYGWKAHATYRWTEKPELILKLGKEGKF